MMFATRQPRVGRWGLVGISASAVVLVAAAAEPDVASDRLRDLPLEGRSRLLANLRRFDLELTPEQQTAARNIDRRLAGLSPGQRVRYELILHRYHAWLETLPENRQVELASKPAAERMALVRKLVGRYPVPTADTQEVLRVIEAGAWSSFELASAYRIWQVLNPTQRARLDRMNEIVRHEALLKMGGRLKPQIPHETIPGDFNEAKWLDAVRNYLRAVRPILLPDQSDRNRLEEAARRKAELLEPPARKKVEDAVRRKEAVRRRILRHQAINLYLAHSGLKSVDSHRLSLFLTALPAWIQTSLDVLPPDEARKRLTLAYRLVFPHPQEIDSNRKPAGNKTESPRSAERAVGGPAARPKAAPPVNNTAPF